MSNWIDAEIIPPKECIGDTKTWCKAYIIIPEYIDDKCYRFIETCGSAFEANIIHEYIDGFFARNNITGGRIYKYKYE